MHAVAQCDSHYSRRHCSDNECPVCSQHVCQDHGHTEANQFDDELVSELLVEMEVLAEVNEANILKALEQTRQRDDMKHMFKSGFFIEVCSRLSQ